MAMAVDSQIERILRLFPDDCRPLAAHEVASAESFSGAQLWRIEAPRGMLCLRRWPLGHPDVSRLEFIQAVLWHVDQEGFRRVPLPQETRHRHGHVWHAGRLWELTPWLPGSADYRLRPSSNRLHNALRSLAEFHLSAATFPLPENGPGVSPGMSERVERLGLLLGGRLSQIRASVQPAVWPELTDRAHELCARFAASAPKLLPVLEVAARLRVPLQPCIRDIWHPHVLFMGDQVSGLVDFGALRPDNVATDVARLLGSMAGDDPTDWQRGLSAYRAVRQLSDDEFHLVTAFDTSTVLMGGLQWLEWIYLEGRLFANRPAVLARVDEFLSRLSNSPQFLG